MPAILGTKRSSAAETRGEACDDPVSVVALNEEALVCLWPPDDAEYHQATPARILASPTAH